MRVQLPETDLRREPRLLNDGRLSFRNFLWVSHLMPDMLDAAGFNTFTRSSSARFKGGQFTRASPTSQASDRKS